MIARTLRLAALAGLLALVAAGANAAPMTSGRHPHVPARKTTTVHSKTTAAKPRIEAPRRLTDVHIEGEMPVPQVLFITARDQRRYVDFQHQRYLRDSRALGATTAAPTRVSVAGDETHH